MTFDPFHDFETHGYLRNVFGEKSAAIIRRLEHSSFVAGVDAAFRQLASVDVLSYRDVLKVHQTLFGDLYPWAGQDRLLTAPDLAVSRGPVLFAHPRDARPAVEHALKMGQDKTIMAGRPGEVMGYLAYGHPFLDGNGRTLIVVHTELAQRAGVSIDWAATSKSDYLTALTRELESPGRNHLDSYLKPFLCAAVGGDRLAQHISHARGLDGKPEQALDANAVLGSFSDPAVQARYKQQELRRSK